jgi:hypothetical protein
MKVAAMEVVMPKGRRPDWNVRAQINGRWEQLGAAWNLDDKDGVSIKLTMIPVGWDGSCVLLKPKSDED